MLSITTHSQDGHTEIRHSIDPFTPALSETSMIPFLDNLHVDKDINHRYRIQFQGSHKLKITRIATQKIARCNCAPIYMFQNKPGKIIRHPISYITNTVSDFLEFQHLLLLKDVVYRGDVHHIKNLTKDTQCRLETIRILYDPAFKERSILYFRTAKSSEQKPGFEEWPGLSLSSPLHYSFPSLDRYWKRGRADN